MTKTKTTIATGPRAGLAKDGTRRGGARPGAGRKPAPLTAIINDYRKAASDQVGPWLPDLLANLKQLADGVKAVDLDPATGEATEYYVVPPDFRANQYLVDRVLGRPTERQEMSGVGGNPIPVAIVAAIDKVYGAEAVASRVADVAD